MQGTLFHLRRNAVAYLALFVALGGTSFAAAAMITGKDVKDSSLTGVDVKTGSLTGSDVKNQSLAPSDFNGSVQGPKGDTGPQGPKGDVGAQGQAGTNGTNATINGVVAGGDLTGTFPNPTIADGAVTEAKLGADVQPAVNFSVLRTAGAILVPGPTVAGVRWRFTCTEFRLLVRFQNFSGTQGEVTLSYLRGSSTPTLTSVADDNGGSGVSVLDTQDNVGGSGQESGAGTMVWTNGVSVVSGNFRYAVDATTCKFFGTMHSGT